MRKRDRDAVYLGETMNRKAKLKIAGRNKARRREKKPKGGEERPKPNTFPSSVNCEKPVKRLEKGLRRTRPPSGERRVWKTW